MQKSLVVAREPCLGSVFQLCFLQTAPSRIVLRFPAGELRFDKEIKADSWTVKALLTEVHKWYTEHFSPAEVKEILAAVRAGKAVDTFSTIRDTLAPNMDEAFEGFPNWDANKVLQVLDPCLICVCGAWCRWPQS
jgi:hypothetical protein